MWDVCIYNITRVCGAKYIGESGRPLKVRLDEHRKNVREDEKDSSRLAEYEGHIILWEEVDILKKITQTLQ